jgi:hypothetical protein
MTAADDPGSVTIRLDNDLKNPFSFAPEPKEFQSAAMRWSYVARSRERWRAGGTLPGQGRDSPLYAYLEPHLSQMARAEVIEVSVPSGTVESEAWAHRVFPWEYVLASAIRSQKPNPPVVIRHLKEAPRGNGGIVDLARPASIESSPAGLRTYYDTRSEGDEVCEALGLDGSFNNRLRDPQYADALSWVRQVEPSLLHLAGVDIHQAIELLHLDSQYPSRLRRDGFVFRSDANANGIEIADAERLADVVCAGARKPVLVMCNFYNSGARLASRMVARGAAAAIGYHDVIDDNLAMLFTETLYRHLAQGSLLLDAFKRAMATVRQQETLRGAGIVLWSGTSLLRASLAKKGRPDAMSPKPVQATAVSGRERIRVKITERQLMNYSLLHNGLSPLSELRIERRNVAGAIRNIRVEVELHAGDASFPFRATVELPDGQDGILLENQVVLPLTSALIRTQSERIQSSLHVTVHCDGELVEERTCRVALAPVDEWQDGDVKEWRLLPSFVLPRDPAVARIVDSAHAILCALADDPTAGFDGYQSVDENGADLEAKYGCVDRQVRAIWYAVLNQHALTYINPPPSYGSSTQRLRTPSQMLEERRGTCIDLALLMAACLEYVGFWPVLFLLRGHAFVGYWRSEAVRDLFLDVGDVAVVMPEGEDVDTGARSALPYRGGVFGADQRLDVQRRINRGDLVALETTWLTVRGGFEAAAEEGRRNIRSITEYQAMIDLKIARASGVTPLPLLVGAR